jgi:ParB family chromosome partitioning protein
MIAPAAVLARLKDAGAQQETEDDGEFIVQGQKLGRIRSSRSGGIQVNLSISQETDIDALIGALRDNLLAMRLREAEPDEAVSG